MGTSTTSDTGLNVTAPATGTYLVMANIQGVRVAFNDVTFELTVDNVVQSAATRVVTFNTGFQEPIGMLHRLTLSAGEVVEIQATSTVADAAQLGNRNLSLIQLD